MWLEFTLFKTVLLTASLSVLCSSLAWKVNVMIQGGWGLPEFTGSTKSYCQTGTYTYICVRACVNWQYLSRRCPLAGLLKALARGETHNFWVKTQDCSMFFSTMPDESETNEIIQSALRHLQN